MEVNTAYKEAFENGVEQFRNNDMQKSIDSFSEAIKLCPNRYAAFINRGTIYLQLSLLSQALSDFNSAIAVDPRDAVGYYNRAMVRLRENRPLEALNDLYISLSCLYLQRGRYSRQIKYLTKSISIVQNNPYAHIERGKLYKIQGNFPLALNDLSTAIDIDRNSSEAYALRSSLYQDMKEKENAEKDMKKVMELSGKTTENRYEMDPQLKTMSNAQVSQEIMTKIKEITDFRNTVSFYRLDGAPEKSSQVIIQQKSQQLIGDKADNQKETKQPLMQDSFGEELLLGDSIKITKQDKEINTSLKEPQSQDHASNSQIDDTVVIEAKLGQIEAEIQRARKQLIQEEGQDVVDSKIDDNLLDMSKGTNSKDNINSEENTLKLLESQIEKQSQIRPASESTPVEESKVETKLSLPTTIQQKENRERQKTVIEIDVISATLTHNTQIFGSMSPYCYFIYADEQRQTKVLHQAGKNPIWNEKIHYQIKNPETKVSVSVWDKETLKNDDLVGEAVFDVHDCLQVEKIPLLFGGKSAGTLFVKIRLL